MNESIETLPEGWSTAHLEDVADILRGVSYAKSDSKDQIQQNYVGILRATNINEGVLDFKNLVYVPKSKVRENQKLIKGDILIAASSGSKDIVGKAAQFNVDLEVGFGAFCSAIRANKEINLRYFHWFFQTPFYRETVSELSSGSNINNLKTSDLSRLVIPIAPEKEQNRIVEKLEELLSDLDGGVAELKAAQVKLNQYRQSLLKSAVEGSLTEEWRNDNASKITESGEQLLARILKERRERWEAQKLKEFSEKDKKLPKNWKEKYPEPVQPDTSDLPELPEGWVWASVDMLVNKIEAGKSFKCLERHPIYDEYGVVKVSAITWGEYDELESKTCTRKDYENDSLLIQKGDFLFSRANTTELVGACVIAEKVTKKIMLSDKILRLKFIDDAVKYWVLQFLRSQWGRGKIEAAASGNQASMKNISQGKLKGFAIPLPPKDELAQIKIDLLSAFENIQKSSAEADIAHKTLTAQRKNMLKDAFSGKLVSQNPSDEPASELLKKIRKERAERAEQPKPPKKKAKLMKSDIETVRNWVLEQKESFTFEQLSGEIGGDYDKLQQSMFTLLEEKEAVVEQVFDEVTQRIAFRRISK